MSNPPTQRARAVLLQERSQCLCRDTLAPPFAADPVGDETLPGPREAAHIAHHVAVRSDRPDHDGVVPADACPMRRERLALPDGERCHPARFGIALVLEEEREVVVDDLA